MIDNGRKSGVFSGFLGLSIYSDVWGWAMEVWDSVIYNRTLLSGLLSSPAQSP